MYCATTRLDDRPGLGGIKKNVTIEDALYRVGCAMSGSCPACG
jgi:hypothetical protein